MCAAHDADDEALGAAAPDASRRTPRRRCARSLEAYVDSVAMRTPGLRLDRSRRDPPRPRRSRTLELAQLRVLADFGSRARQNARLFTLARSLRAQAEERERERARLSDRLLDGRGAGAPAPLAGPARRPAADDRGRRADARGGALGPRRRASTRRRPRVIRLAMDRTRGIVRDLRRLTFALEPITLRDHGFSAAFGELAAQTADAHGIEVDGRRRDRRRPRAPDPGLPLPDRAGGAREHGQACRRDAASRCVPTAGATAASSSRSPTTDAGRRPEQLDRRGHHQGVDAMRERASGIGATLRFEETPGGGTTVRVIVPRASARGPETPARRLTRASRAAAGAAPPREHHEQRCPPPRRRRPRRPGSAAAARSRARDRSAAPRRRSARPSRARGRGTGAHPRAAASTRASRPPARRRRRAGTRATRRGTSAGRSSTARSPAAGSAARSRGPRAASSGPPKSSWLK